MQRTKEQECSLGLMITRLPNEYIIKRINKVCFKICKGYTRSHNNTTKVSFKIHLSALIENDKDVSVREFNQSACFTIATNKHHNGEMLLNFFNQISLLPDAIISAKGKLIADGLIIDSIELICIGSRSIHPFRSDPVSQDYDCILKMLVFDTKPKNLKLVIKTIEGLKLFYDLYQNHYPSALHEWIKYCIASGKQDKACRFLSIDWEKKSLTLPSKEEAYKILDESLYGMKNVKDNIISILEIARRSGRVSFNILLCGPAGVGKTTVAQAVARVFNLPMSIIPMATCQDAEAFSGFASTYSGAQEALWTTCIFNPKYYDAHGKTTPVNQIEQIAFLNELDKTNRESNNHGSVQSVLLRMLDDNREFYDVYYETSYPLDNVMVIADVNDVSKLQKPLLDRFFVINVEGYSTEEKIQIFKQYVFPKALKDACIPYEELSVSEEAIELICKRSSEPGIREIRHTANAIIGDYLVKYNDPSITTVYTADMVRKIETVNKSQHSYFRL